MVTRILVIDCNTDLYFKKHVKLPNGALSLQSYIVANDVLLTICLTVIRQMVYNGFKMVLKTAAVRNVTLTETTKFRLHYMTIIC